MFINKCYRIDYIILNIDLIEISLYFNSTSN